MEQLMKPFKVRVSISLAFGRLGACALGVVALGCGGRAADWSLPVEGVQAYGLSQSVVLVDTEVNRAVSLGVDGHGALTETPLRTGHDIVATAVGPDGHHLYILTAGHRGTLGDTQPDEAPRLTIVDGTTSPATSRDVSLDVLTDPLDGLAIDPTDHWAVLYAASGTSTAFVTNPNQLVVVDLASTGAAPPRTIALHSFGSHPEKLVFTPQLGLPLGPSHLLIVQSADALSLLSLDDGTKPEITVRLADATAVTSPHPAQIVVDDGDPTRTDDARIGIRFDGEANVMTLQLEPDPGPNGYAPTINLAAVGGVPSAIAFVRTDGGLRLAALVPASATAVLVDPVTTITSSVSLPAGYGSLSLVTAETTASATADTALLWNASTQEAGVAFWELGEAAGQPFRSIETVGIDAKVDGVEDVPAPNSALKVLSTASAGAFYVLDLGDRTATPLLTSSSDVSLVVSPTGKRVWAFVPGGLSLASTDLGTKAVRTLQVDTPVSAVFEIGPDTGTRTLLALHAGLEGAGATLFDAANPDDAKRRIYGSLLTEGPYER
jgi:hypothetical protein